MIDGEEIEFYMMQIYDIDEVVVMEKQCFNVPWSRNAFRNELLHNDKAYYISGKNREGKIVAYGGMWIVIDEAHITNIAVSKEYRRMGIGEKLMMTLIMLAVKAGAKAMTLEVRASNIAAISLYEGLGFTSAGLRKGYYTDNKEDAHIMWNYEIENLYNEKA